MTHLTIVSAVSQAPVTAAHPALEKKARHLRALINVLACDGGERLAEELTEETRGDTLELLEDLAIEVQRLSNLSPEQVAVGVQ